MYRKRKCKGCKEFWRPETELPKYVNWCSDECKLTLAMDALEKVKKARIRSLEKAKREEKKKYSRQKKEFYDNDKETRRIAAVTWFNRWVLLRDREDGCISCGTTETGVKYDAGHYKTAGSCTALRFNPNNVNKQCSNNCNKHLSGNIIGYRKGLLRKYGEEVVDFLEGPQPLIKISVGFYKEIEDEFKRKCKEMM